MVGGTCPTVGAAGGYLAGGGYGILTQEHGLAVDNALQIKVVLPNGTYVTTNRYQNQDLFFALRGGGGGTFGIVTEVTSKVILDNKSVTVSCCDTLRGRNIVNDLKLTTIRKRSPLFPLLSQFLVRSPKSSSTTLWRGLPLE